MTILQPLESDFIGGAEPLVRWEDFIGDGVADYLRILDPDTGRPIFQPLPDLNAAVILADPPWAYRTYCGTDVVPQRTKKQHYKTLPLPLLKMIPVVSVAAKDCVLIMWVIDCHIEQALELARSWGFTFKTKVFTWRKLTNDRSKTRMSLGRWSRKETEIALLFTRGRPKRLHADVREIIDAPIREHSRKPDEQYERIERLVSGPYLELFARHTRPAWSTWGNETTRFNVFESFI